MSKIDRPTPNKAPESLMSQLSGSTLYIGQELQPEPQVNPNEILHDILDNIHDGDKEELTGNLILMLGWLHKGGTMPNILKDTVTTTTLWIIPND
jgi:5,10-methenyltetrahydromethanopterin hydrogenase